MSSAPDAQDLRRYYASLSDDALLALDRSDLTETGQRCYDEELVTRKVSPAPDGGTEEEPEWLDDAACACSFDSFPGNDSTPDLEQARTILESAGVPCYVKISDVEASTDSGPRYRSDLLIPGGLILAATSMLDKELFNPRLETEWCNHLQELSNEDFEALSLEDLTAGLIDRVERLERVYNDEATRRSGQ